VARQSVHRRAHGHAVLFHAPSSQRFGRLDRHRRAGQPDPGFERSINPCGHTYSSLWWLSQKGQEGSGGAWAGIILRTYGGGLDVLTVILNRKYGMRIGVFYFLGNAVVMITALGRFSPDTIIASLGLRRHY